MAVGSASEGALGATTGIATGTAATVAAHINVAGGTTPMTVAAAGAAEVATVRCACPTILTGVIVAASGRLNAVWAGPTTLAYTCVAATTWYACPIILARVIVTKRTHYYNHDAANG